MLSLQIPNGFGSHSPELATSLPWTSGALLSASRKALDNGFVAVAPVAGFHHARFDCGGGFCTFNGILVAAAVLLKEGKVARVGILDLDMHFGDGSEDIIKQLRLDYAILHYSAGCLLKVAAARGGGAKSSST